MIKTLSGSVRPQGIKIEFTYLCLKTITARVTMTMNRNTVISDIANSNTTTLLSLFLDCIWSPSMEIREKVIGKVDTCR